MKDGTIILIKPNITEETPWLEKTVFKAIQFFTGSLFHHVYVYSKGKTYEFAKFRQGKKWYSGVVVNDGLIGWGDVYLEPKEDLTDEQANKIAEYFETALEKRYPYNVARLLILAIVYPTRWFWNLIKWVPFSKVTMGEVCSTSVDESFKHAGIDLFEKSEEDLTAPGDFLKLIELGTFKQSK